MQVVKVIGIEEVNAKLRALANRSMKKDNGTVVVGYTQRYAIYVHEVQAKHKEGKQWKYLETAVRRLAPQIPKIVETIYWYSQSIVKGLLVAGLRIQRDSMKMVPIDTGALRASAYTAKLENAPAAAATARARAEAKESAVKQKRTNKQAGKTIAKNIT